MGIFSPKGVFGRATLFLYFFYYYYYIFISGFGSFILSIFFCLIFFLCSYFYLPFDDIFIFTNGSWSSLQRLMDFLHHYEAISRQFQAKSNFYIGGSASASHQDIVHSVTSFQWHQLSFIYLRCLAFTEHLKISLFNDMVRKGQG